MVRDKATARFPRTAYIRRIWTIMEDLEYWRKQYLKLAAQSQSAALRWKLEERAQGCDEVYHHLADACTSWKLWT